MTDQELMEIGQAIERAARELPDCWGIRIDIENGAGSVEAILPDGSVWMIDGGETFSSQINDAIDVAMKGGEK